MRKTRNVLDRFWEKVDKSGGPDACWPWTGATNQYGYGRFNVGGRAGKLRPAHVFAWEIVNGALPPEHFGGHTCTNNGCCNPAHVVPKMNPPKQPGHPSRKGFSSHLVEVALPGDPKERARRIARNAILGGTLIPPKTCSKCHRPTKAIDAHHWDYDRPLDVIWLCKWCHIATHRTRKAAS